jgi:hypothetical protein
MAIAVGLAAATLRDGTAGVVIKVVAHPVEGESE